MGVQVAAEDLPDHLKAVPVDDLPEHLREHVDVSFSPSTATDEELRQASIGGNRPAIDEFHKRHLAESNPTLGAAAEEFINKAISGLGNAAMGIPAALKTAAGAVIGFGDPMHPLAVEARQTLKGMLDNPIKPNTESPGVIGKAYQQLGDLAMTAGSPRQMPKSQFGKAGEAIGENLGMVAAPEALGTAVRGAAKAIPAMAEKASSRLVNSLIKTQPKEFRFGKNPGLEVAQQGIVAATPDALLEKISKRSDAIHKEVRLTLKMRQNMAKQVDISPAIDVVEKAIKEASSSGEQGLYDRLTTLKDQITRGFEVDEAGKLIAVGEPRLSMNPLETNDLKVKIGKDTKWTGQAFDGDVNKVRVGIYGTLNDLVDQAVPGIKARNSQVANLIGAEKSLEREINLGERRNLTGHIFSKGAAGVIGSLAGHYAGAPWEAGAVAGMAAEKLLGSTPSKTLSAAALAKITRRKSIPAGKVIPRRNVTPFPVNINQPIERKESYGP